MYYVYVIQSETTNRYYIGMTADLVQRLRHHNSGANKSTRGKDPRRMVYTEELPDRSSAWKRERVIKSYKGGGAFKKLLNISGEVA
ncbi:MAG: GIY-YIG nuclease family protein [Patescibacteria group bacterium]